MKYAFVFPGQGSQHIGMGLELYQNFKSAKDVFDEVDDALKQNLFKLMKEGPESELTLTTNAQPAIMAVSMAVIRVLEREFQIDLPSKISYVAGHSLGEYSAACAARIFSLSDTAKLLRLRGNAMQKAVPAGMGGMVAVLGISLEDAEALAQTCRESGDCCVVANDNSLGQVVLSGHIKAIQKASEIASEFGAKKAVILSVSAPFHSPLMEPAARTMEKALHEVQSFDPVVPLISNVTAKPSLNKEEILTNLQKQTSSLVRWRETMNFLNDEHITDLIEIGAGNILSNLCKRDFKSIFTCSVHSKETIEDLVHNL